VGLVGLRLNALQYGTHERVMFHFLSKGLFSGAGGE